MKNNTNNLLMNVSETIRKIGIPVHLSGYRYLRTAVILGIQQSEYLDAITKKLYPTIAKEHKTTPARVERAIRHCVESAWINRRKELNELMDRECVKRPTNSEVISMIADNIILKEIAKKASKYS